MDSEENINQLKKRCNLEDILFYRSIVDCLITEQNINPEEMQYLKSFVRSLINDCIESSLEYSGVSGVEINRLKHLLR